MARETKPVVDKEATFDQVELRLGRVVQVSLQESSPKKAYRIVVDFGKFGRKTSVGRFTHHSEKELMGQLVVGALNFGTRQVGDADSECLILGVQFPKAESGEATFLTPANPDAKIGGKVF